ncbi:hypothetical protein GE061_016984 [Apolygus lucorum]|uniref:Uncharacterized protein n=1 Tax=Apolygus lucorum TaxID=248454 RepID=A0A8S9XKE0_APOLU|nr:hypothetical protein GE061_016984 [Apolygus lucorum]
MLFFVALLTVSHALAVKLSPEQLVSGAFPSLISRDVDLDPCKAGLRSGDVDSPGRPPGLAGQVCLRAVQLAE